MPGRDRLTATARRGGGVRRPGNWTGLAAFPIKGRLHACPTSHAYYDKKRAEAKAHRQAAGALSRRRVDVLWACIRDNNLWVPESRPSQLSWGFVGRYLPG
jgi:hypothetical protein